MSLHNPTEMHHDTDRHQRQQQDKQQATRPEETDTLKLKKAWEIAMAPSKQLPMQAIMMYMSGNTLQIFSIMMVLMLFKGPIQGLINTNAAFAKYETPTTKARLVGVKAVYVLMQLLLFALGVWKVNGMGLLPYVPINLMPLLMLYTNAFDRTTRSDWLAWESERQPLERAFFAFK